MNTPLIIVTDDDKDFKLLIADFLNSNGFETKLACNGEEALQLAHECKPALILMDVDMPGKNGLQVADQLRKDPRTSSVKILFISSLGENAWAQKTEEHRVLSKQLASFDYFQKGNDFAILLKMILKNLTA